MIKTNILPKSIVAITLYPFIFTRSLDQVTINHERIHLRQQIELLVIMFYVLYFFEWMFKGYKGISFEKEAYKNEENLNYLKQRKTFSWVKYF